MVGKYLLYLFKWLVKWQVFQKNTGNPVYFMYNKGKRIDMSAIIIEVVITKQFAKHVIQLTWHISFCDCFI